MCSTHILVRVAQCLPLWTVIKPHFTDEMTKRGWHSAGSLTQIFRLLPGEPLFYSWSRALYLPGFQGIPGVGDRVNPERLAGG